ncbi:hypothetical protein GNI_012630 [Gregarina niphandrodes]|uniref:Uncharacterized protein n=1 Tax=Gregarina niphandrodes TaxID=110365 RepID=A0A023BCK0_GRENI|nr:hypothetical protein GNI_012630 [Gregarina niphandrodes]EZG84532.1 hypothetical protein GNI_012630 [Gregarina niphandrodes]|eukprot:XP_011128860.1 hypothetical protein GNI_012630 [Gregarina niphandrodes]
MPFGLINADATFQRVTTKLLEDRLGSGCLVYIDDIVICGSSWPSLTCNFEWVLQRLRDREVFLKHPVLPSRMVTLIIPTLPKNYPPDRWKAFIRDRWSFCETRPNDIEVAHRALVLGGNLPTLETHSEAAAEEWLYEASLRLQPQRPSTETLSQVLAMSCKLQPFRNASQTFRVDASDFEQVMDKTVRAIFPASLYIEEVITDILARSHFSSTTT